jgi:ribosomal-protein-serine acetyltransferase
MFTYKIDEKTALKMLHLHDAEPLFKLINQSRASLREWLSFIDHT